MKRFLPVLLAGLVLSACTSPLAPGPTPTPELTAPEILQRAQAALLKVNSFHFELGTDTGGKPAAGAFNLLSAKGDVARPDKLSAELSVAVAGFNASVKYVSTGGKHYITDPISQQWMEVPPQFNTIALFSPDQGAAGVLRSMTELTRGANDKIDGVDCYRVSGKTEGKALQPILGVAPTTPLQVAAWVGIGDFLVRQVVVTGAVFQGEPDSTTRNLKITQFNAPVNITAPIS